MGNRRETAYRDLASAMKDSISIPQSLYMGNSGQLVVCFLSESEGSNTGSQETRFQSEGRRLVS